MEVKISYKKGDKLGNLLFLEELPFRTIPSGQKQRMAKFQCECGNEFITSIGNAKSNRSKTCGCGQIQAVKDKLTKHNQSNTNNISSEYRTWLNIKSRSTNLNIDCSKNYSKRGISICDRWLNSFENFFADMGTKPGKEYSIERINNNGNYEPSNCKWATKTEQNNNRRSNYNINYNNITQSLAKWSEYLNIPAQTIKSRMDRGLSIEESFSKEFKYFKK